MQRFRFNLVSLLLAIVVLGSAYSSGVLRGFAGTAAANQRTNAAVRSIQPAGLPDSEGRIFASVPDQDRGCDCVIVMREGGRHDDLGVIGTRHTAYPQALAVDASQNLYVGNSVTSSNIFVFRPGHATAFRRLTTPDGAANGIVVGHDGTVYVATSGHGNFIDEYAPGAQTPTQRFTDPHFKSLSGVALDRAGNLYVTYTAMNGTGQVIRYAPQSEAGTNLGLKVGSPSGIAVDSQNELVIADRAARAVDVFRPGSTHPVRRISQPNTDPSALAFNAQRTHLFVMENVEGSFQGSYVYEFDYATGQLLSTVLINFFGFGSGVAVSPAGG